MDTTSRCYYCRFPVNPQNEFCPGCNYPVSPAKEEAFLKAELDALRQAAAYGGANMKVSDLILRYQSRLQALHMRASKPAPALPVVQPANHREAGVSTSLKIPLAETPTGRAEERKPVAVPAQGATGTPRRVFSWKSFFADQAINIVASLGAFLILVGALGFTATTPNLLLAFEIVFIVHAVFGITGFTTYRFASFRIVATIYTIIFALLVPLVAFSAYRLIANNYIELSVPVLVAISAIYAAIVYTVLAIYQRFPLFAYLGMVALAVADFALADALNLRLWWWPSMLMILTFLTLLSTTRPSGKNWPFTGNLAILREPVRVFMKVSVIICASSVVLLALFSFTIGRFGVQDTEVRFSIFSLALLILLWSGLFFWLNRRTRNITVLAFLFLASVLALCYALRFEAIGYALALTVVALLYHGLSRFANQRLHPFGTFERDLDWTALALVLLVPIISSPVLPLQLFMRAYSIGAPYQRSWQTFAEIVALTAGIVLTLSVTFKRASFQRIPAHADWTWLLLLSIFLLHIAYSLVILALNLAPDWYFLGLALALMTIAVFVRRQVSAEWALPLDVGTLFAIAFTLGLSLKEPQDTISALLLFFAVAIYGVLLYQRRQNWLFVPVILALLAVPTLMSRPAVMLIGGLLLPLAAVVIRRQLSANRAASHANLFTGIRLADTWEWPLLATGLVYAIVVSANDVNLSTSTIQNWLGKPFPVAVELGGFALAWYAAAALARIKVWLLPSLGFALGALLIPTNSFWTLVSLTPVLAILGIAISRLAGRDWAWPVYAAALLGGIMTGYTGFVQGHLEATALALLAFAVLAYVLSALEDEIVPMWVTPVFATWSVIISAGFLNELYHPPIVAIVAAALAVSISYFNLAPFYRLVRSTRRHSFIRYALPLYATALSAVALTGVFGSLSDINRPFYGAVPDAMLLYGMVAFAVLLYEKRPTWLWLSACLLVWGTVLATRLTPYYVLGIGVGAAIVGLAISLITKATAIQSRASAPLQLSQRFTWNWPWYLVVLVAAVETGNWTLLDQSLAGFIPYSLLVFTAIALLIMLVERQPEMLVFPVGLAVWAIWLWHPPLNIAPLMIVYTLLCVLVFATRFIWKIVPPAKHWLPASSLHEILGLGGQALIVLVIIGQGGLSADSGTLAQVGVGALFVLAALLFAYGFLRTSKLMQAVDGDHAGSAVRLQQAKEVQRWCYYGAGLLLSLVVSWELSALHQTRVDVLLLAPASYLAVIAPFLMHDTTLREHHRVGQTAALLGAFLLLLPALWFSFSDSNLLPTLILVGEAMVLLVLGIITRIRIFILSSAALIIAGTLRALFLSTPPSLGLMFLGGALLAIATTLILARHKLQVAWSQWE